MPLITSANTTKLERIILCTTATRLGLSFSELPSYLDTTLGNENGFRQTSINEVCAEYTQPYGRIDLTIFNE